MFLKICGPTKLEEDLSEDEASATKGGDLGYFNDGDMVDEFDAAAANDGYYKRSTIDSYEIYGYYFLNRKEDDPNNINYGKYNIYNCVFKVDLTTEAGVSGSFFYVMRFYNIMILEDGSCSVNLQVNERDGYAMEIGKEWFLGYDTVESMFSDCVTANIDKYEYITNIEE